MPEVLGAEYGALAGRTPEEALKLTMQYATGLEDKLGYNEEDDKKPDEPKPDTLTIVRGMNAASKEPITTEFVGNREAAKSAARLELMNNDPSFAQYESYIENVMSKMDAKAQTDPKNWVEAYWYIWGQAQRIAQQNADKESDEARQDTPPVAVSTETVTHDSRVNAARGTPRGRPNVSDQFKIDDPDERRTKQQFERILGKRMSDEEWHRLQHDDIRTLEEYEDLQEDLKQRSR